MSNIWIGPWAIFPKYVDWAFGNFRISQIISESIYFRPTTRHWITVQCLKLAGPYSKGGVILKKLRHTWVWHSRLGNTQNLGILEFPKVFQNPFKAHIALIVWLIATIFVIISKQDLISIRWNELSNQVKFSPCSPYTHYCNDICRIRYWGTT